MAEPAAEFLALLPDVRHDHDATEAGPVWTFSRAEAAAGGLLFFYHRAGFDEFTAYVVRRLTGLGYVVTIPDVFDGMAPGDGPDDRKRQLVDARVIDAAVGALAVLRERAPDVRPPAALGFGTGGRLAFLAAAAQVGVARASCFYGNELDRGWHDDLAPIDRIAVGNPPVQLFRGLRDSQVGEAQHLAALSAVDAVGGVAEATTYASTRHAFANPFDAVRYDRTSAERGWSAALAFLGDGS